VERAPEPCLAHQARHPSLADTVAEIAEILEDARRTVRLPTRVMGGLDEHKQGTVRGLPLALRSYA
jgi:hypothetical protein